MFAEDISIRRYTERSNNIVHWFEFNRGGHFAAMEAPDLIVRDVREFFRGFLSAGFEIAHQYGDYRFVPFDRTSPYVVTWRAGHVGQGVVRIGTIDMAPLGSASDLRWR